jgi:hypothetical protein
LVHLLEAATEAGELADREHAQGATLGGIALPLKLDSPP